MESSSLSVNKMLIHKATQIELDGMMTRLKYVESHLFALIYANCSMQSKRKGNIRKNDSIKM